MKLLTHNMLSSKCTKGVTVGYPLRIVAKDVKITKTEFNADLVTKMISYLDWKVLVNAAAQIGHGDVLPENLHDNYEDDVEFLKKAHHILLEVEVTDGVLICPKTKRVFPILSNGIPNLLINEDEVS